MMNISYATMQVTSFNQPLSPSLQNPRDASTILTFARQFSPLDPKSLVNVYKHATKNPYSYLLIDLAQDTPEEFRLISNIFYENNQDFLIYERN